ncbi:hypothetical protein B566_EDAN014565 [Ephemera danica]|nr:hypothetical protein B566_EDAN014565 [Ephemera danica]
MISNASDALEKLRYERLTAAGQQEPGQQTSAAEEHQRALEIRIDTDKMTRTFSIQDSGIGMTREELISNLGTIARSGSKVRLTHNLQWILFSV